MATVETQPMDDFPETYGDHDSRHETGHETAFETETGYETQPSSLGPASQSPQSPKEITRI